MQILQVSQECGNPSSVEDEESPGSTGEILLLCRKRLVVQVEDSESQTSPVIEAVTEAGKLDQLLSSLSQSPVL